MAQASPTPVQTTDKAQDQQADLWLQDFAKAKARAKAEKKDLLVDFTGSDWCGWCIKLDSEVFSKDEFQNSAPRSFVLVKLDYPQNEALVTPEIKAQNEKLQQTYNVQGFPTILLMTPEGQVFGQTGYQEGGPEPYNTMLAEMQKQGAAFKAALLRVEGTEGGARAKALDEALGTLDEAVAETYHFEIMKEILTLDADGAAGLKDKWAAKVANIETARMANEAAQELNELIGPDMQAGEGDKALAKLDAVIKAPKNKMQHQMAMFFKGMVIMDTSGDAKAAIAVLEAGAALAPDSPIGQQITQILPRIKQQAGGGK